MIQIHGWWSLVLLLAATLLSSSCCIALEDLWMMFRLFPIFPHHLDETCHDGSSSGEVLGADGSI